MKTTLVFYGTSPFAVPSLNVLAKDERFEILAVVTQPDRPAGRKGELTKPAIKITAEELGFRVIQPERLKTEDARKMLEEIGGDLGIAASYGQIIPQAVLDLYSKGMINVHGSILPEYRGASPINAAIRDGRSETGITIMVMDAKMDHGPVLATATESIHDDDTTASLTPRLADLGSQLLTKTLPSYLDGSIKPVDQDHEKATFVKLLTREDGRLDPTEDATALERLVRAMDPWPGTFFEHEGKRLKVLKTRIGAKTEHEPGELFVADGDLFLACADGSSLNLETMQPEGKNAMKGAAFARGMKR